MARALLRLDPMGSPAETPDYWPSAAPTVAGIVLEDRMLRQVRLRAAVLLEAIRCLEGTSGSPSERLSLQRQAVRWFRGAGGRSPFSFAGVCESLGLDPRRVRRQVFLLRPGSRQNLVRQVLAGELRASGGGSFTELSRAQ